MESIQSRLMEDAEFAAMFRHENRHSKQRYSGARGRACPVCASKLFGKQHKVRIRQAVTEGFK